MREADRMDKKEVLFWETGLTTSCRRCVFRAVSVKIRNPSWNKLGSGCRASDLAYMEFSRLICSHYLHLGISTMLVATFIAYISFDRILTNLGNTPKSGRDRYKCKRVFFVGLMNIWQKVKNDEGSRLKVDSLEGIHHPSGADYSLVVL